MALNLLTSLPRQRGLLGVEKATLAYTLLTTVLILLFRDEMSAPLRLLMGRSFVLLGMAATMAVYYAAPNRATLILRTIYPLTLLSYWYPDTYEFCQLFPNLDYVFAGVDQALFSCQPSLEFARHLPSVVWSELFHLGYFSYYPLIFITALAPLFYRRELFGETAYIILTSFLVYYLIYLFLPVAGPQYYFHAVGLEEIETGRFPMLGDYFRHHTELRPSTAPEGLFCSLVEVTQASGERPTAAFPSSHVGMSTILMMLLSRTKRPLLLGALPFYILLCLSTVYIEAHYLIDSLCGLFSAPLVYTLAHRLYEVQRNRRMGPEFA